MANRITRGVLSCKGNRLDVLHVAITCRTNEILCLCEHELRNKAKRETEFDQEVWMYHCAVLTQKYRFRHEETCAVCLLDEGSVQ
jgi:hypothetical protein